MNGINWEMVDMDSFLEQIGAILNWPEAQEETKSNSKDK